MPTSYTLPCGPPVATVFAKPRITIAGQGAMYGNGQLRHIRQNGVDDTHGACHPAKTHSPCSLCKIFSWVRHVGTCVYMSDYRAGKTMSLFTRKCTRAGTFVGKTAQKTRSLETLQNGKTKKKKCRYRV